MNISDIDKNFSTQTPVTEGDRDWYDVRRAPFRIYGLYHPENGARFRRMDEDVAKTVNSGVVALNYNTSGGRIRFSTDSEFIAIEARWENFCVMGHMAATGSAGFDIYYEDENGSVFADSAITPNDAFKGYDPFFWIYKDLHPGMVSVTINLPLYNEVTSLRIGVKQGSRVEEGRPVADMAPIVYYGSSITQGGCASRPGTCYQSRIFHRNNIDYINLGFSGNALGEQTMADYIASLDMSIFVMDYDHNAPNTDHLSKTHYPFYRTIREKNPDLPIIFVSHPESACFKWDSELRHEIVRATYTRAIAEGDKNVYHVNGKTMLTDAWSECTVDGCHPTDLGFHFMAEKIGAVIDHILEVGRL